jgi:type II secretory pathway predicted ATPase ExeA
LDPLTPDDTKALIEYRLMAAGRDGRQNNLFTDDAILPIWQETRGYPRSICLLCLHLCLDLLDQSANQITGEFVTDFLKRQHSYRRLGDAPSDE